MAIRTLTFALAAVVAVAAGPADPAAQNPSTPARDAQVPGVGTASLSGVAVDAASSQPLARVRVGLTGSGATRVTLTDAAGRFQFPRIPAGSYEISATLDPFVPARFGEKKPGRPGTPIALADRQEIKNLTIRMTRGGVIAGVVITPSGQPSTGTMVRALRLRYSEAGPGLEEAGSSKVDDRGQYRIFGLVPGDYIVMAQPRIEDLSVGGGAPDPGDLQPQLSDGYAPSYFPGTPAANQSTPVTVAAGEERAGTDIVLPLLPLARLRGSVSGPGGPLLYDGRVTLIRDDDIALPGAVRPSAYTQSGRFAFGGVAPGQYTLTMLSATTPPGPGTPPPGSYLYGVSHVSVGGSDLNNLTMTLQPGVTVSGRVTFAGGPPPASLASVRVSLTSAGGTTRESHYDDLDAQGRFAIPDVSPGSFRFGIVAFEIQGWSMQSVVSEGHDVVDTALEVGSQNPPEVTVTFTRLQAEISGTTRDAAGQTAADCTVIVFPADKRLWPAGARRIRSARPGADGRFRLPRLLAGDLLIAAVDDVDPGEWFNPLYLERLTAAATHVALTTGEKKTVDLRVLVDR